MKRNKGRPKKEIKAKALNISIDPIVYVQAKKFLKGRISKIAEIAIRRELIKQILKKGE